jgi:hypothetical protein
LTHNFLDTWYCIPKEPKLWEGIWRGNKRSAWKKNLRDWIATQADLKNGLSGLWKHYPNSLTNQYGFAARTVPKPKRYIGF